MSASIAHKHSHTQANTHRWPSGEISSWENEREGDTHTQSHSHSDSWSFRWPCNYPFLFWLHFRRAKLAVLA